jgi:hypothetical protein
MGGSGGRRGRRAALAAAVAVVASGAACVGATDRSDFEAEIESRGGGFSEDVVAEAVDAIAEEVGTDDFEITRLVVSPLTPVVAAQVRDPRAPDQLDDYTFRGDELVDVQPVRLSAGTDLDSEALPIDTFALERLDEVVDVALEEFGAADGYATSVQLSVTPLSGIDGDPVAQVVVAVESSRAAATVRFTADGELVGIDPQ